MGTGDTDTLKMVVDPMRSPHVSAESEPAPGRQWSQLSDKVNQTVHKPLKSDINQANQVFIPDVKDYETCGQRVHRTQIAALQQDSMILFPSKLQKDEFHLESSQTDVAETRKSELNFTGL